MHNASLFTFPCLVLLLLLSACEGNSFKYEGPKLEGVSLVAPPDPIGPEVMQELQGIGVEWVSLMPYAFARPGDTVLHHNTERQWWGERDEGLLESIRLAQEQGLQVMLKPHLWLQDGSFTGDLSFDTLEQWQAWERSYTSYLLHHAHLADSMQVPLLCIGTELTRHNQQRPQYWQQLIDTIRSVYSGRLTYAANWDGLAAFPHWHALDFIGVDAYFPLSELPKPTVAALAEAWQPHLQDLGRLAGKYQKPILFTEWGYRSISGTSREPWQFDAEGAPDAEAQAVAYQAIFEKVWPEPWFAGGFVWKWYPRLPTRHHDIEIDFTPQGKPAQEVLKDNFGRQE
ncbi:hypothetical protein D770_25650 [Flammeovirgaceae bacterium 311]|nr:hypothetical protein D770_25650 [Flammeovirgaceae bacterium 311]